MTKNKVVLVIEDERPLAEAIKIKLEKTGFAVVSARSVAQTLNYLKDQVQIDAIWLDHYLLGQENGLDLVAQVKEDDSKWKNIPIFVVSNTATADKVQSYLRLGINKYYTKSNFRLDDIIHDIEDFLNGKTGKN
jgi:CheY-like chemotaxis protein